MMKKWLPVLLVGVSLVCGSAASAAHYLSGTSAVDGKEIRWGGSTSYALNFSNGVATWNTIRPITIAPDTAWTVEDLTLSDVNCGCYPWYGSYQYYGVGADRLFFNQAVMGGLSTSQRNHVTTHELGHALGLAHSISGNVMSDVQWNTIPGSQDLSDYHYLWGY